MLDTALSFFKDELTDYIKVKAPRLPGVEEAVKFSSFQPGTNKINLTPQSITALLINLEEERLFRSGAAQSSRLIGGSNSVGSHDLCMNFHLLFIASYSEYLDSLKVVSLTLKFFRSCRLFTQQRFPALSPDILQLSTELVNLTFMEQGELWRSLEIPCHPSVLYKVKMLVFPDSEIDDVEIGTELATIETVTASR